MNLHQLRLLVSCENTRDIAATARQCGVSHGVVVRSMRALESELQVELFHLRARPLAFTLRGERLARDAEHILGVMNQSVEGIRCAQNRLVGSLRIAVSMSYSHRLVYEILRDFASRAPEVRLDLRDVPFPSHIIQLQHQELDIAVLFPAWKAPSVSFETLLHERVTVALPAGHRLARVSQVRLRQLATEKWLTFYKPQSGRVGIDFFEACKRVGFVPQIVQNIASPVVRLAHVELNEGITLLPSSYDSGVRRTIKRVLVHPADLNLPTAILWNSNDLRRVTEAFIASARSTVGRIYRKTKAGRDTDFESFFLPPTLKRADRISHLGEG